MTPLSSEFQMMAEDEQQRKEREIEEKIPGVRQIFDTLIVDSSKIDPYEHDLSEFPIYAALATYDDNKQQWIIQQWSGNTTLPAHHVGMSTNHAEKRVIEQAQKQRRSKHLGKTALFTNLEPCAMCSEAFLHSLDTDEEGIIVFGASQKDLAGKGVALRTDAWYNDETGLIEVSKKVKPFRTEPPSYTAEAFVAERNPRVEVIGGYRAAEALAAMSTVDL